ncbi:chorismate mutase 2-like [Humulus lupulus]|uniref:chorismate mutase 2-like n=1 Tax=Humulus lupulus TaxID=3486 RepID=UPI002B40D5AA|nr:chorismate mutase 2-like [Humulus lupulus]XP_062097203.1 chorismate mutase 2-like [Humulus lupulus]
MATSTMENNGSDLGDKGMTLDTVRDSLIRQEDTIIFSLIERAKFPMNSPTYQESKPCVGFCGSLIRFFVNEAESLQAKAGRYQNPEEHAFFPDHLPPSLAPTHSFPQVLHPAAASTNVNNKIWDIYFKQLLPLFTVPGDDGNYASTASSDLNCLQAISRRIHYGNFVAEVKFRDAPHEYEPAIRSQDRDALMKLLTFEAVEEVVKKRVEKKAMIFGQEVSLNTTSTESKEKYKIDPALVSRLYDEWIMPLTKFVQVEYLLRRLD